MEKYNVNLCIPEAMSDICLYCLLWAVESLTEGYSLAPILFTTRSLAGLHPHQQWTPSKCDTDAVPRALKLDREGERISIIPPFLLSL